MAKIDNPNSSAKQSKQFLYLYALAVAGGSIAYIPFLTILLPVRAAQIAGNNAISLLAYAAFFGAISASIANIGFGWLSDRSKGRRSWIVAGLVGSSVLLPAMQFATGPVMLIAMIICWQIALNMMLAPLLAWAGDCVPDSQKGLLGGLLALAPALGALSGTLVTLDGFASSNGRLLWVAALVIALVCPVLLFGKPVSMPHLMAPQFGTDDLPLPNDAQQAGQNRGVVLRMWLARFLVQIAEASLFAFLLLWFNSLDPDFGENRASGVFTAVLGAAVIFSLMVGRWSDRTDRPILPLALCSGLAALGLAIMAMTPTMLVAISGYVIFGLGSNIFLALHSSQTLRVLPSRRTRGRDLGFFNLTNTVPSLIMPWLTLALVPTHGFGALFILLTGLTVMASVLLFTMIRRMDVATAQRSLD
jgi:MFS family permease